LYWIPWYSDLSSATCLLRLGVELASASSSSGSSAAPDWIRVLSVSRGYRMLVDRKPPTPAAVAAAIISMGLLSTMLVGICWKRRLPTWNSTRSDF